MTEPTVSEGSRPTARWSAWARLVRLPNLLTAPGDPLAGAFLCALATGYSLSPRVGLTAAACSLCVYAGGLIGNDLADLPEDQVQRRFRPLASGAITVRRAVMVERSLVVLALLLAGSLGWPVLVAVLTLQGSVWFYNRRAMRPAPFGPLAMGVCRGLSVLSGAVALAGVAALSAPLVWAGVLGTTAYIAAVTRVAAGELSAGVGRGRRWGPPLAVAVLTVVLWTCRRPLSPVGMAVAVIALTAVTVPACRLSARSAPHEIQRAIGAWIRALLAIQALSCALSPGGGEIMAVFLLLAWPLNARLAKPFYAT